MIVVTGGAGFIGSNLIKLLNQNGYKNIIVVDSLTNKNSFKNLTNLQYCDFFNFENGLDYLKKSLERYPRIDVIFHIGANADVLEEDGNKFLEMNFEHSKFWFDFAASRSCSLIYASSSAVYGNSKSFKVAEENEQPHNKYAFSKLLFDKFVRFHLANIENQVVGFRFFNVFGLGEAHKGKNASLPYRFFKFITDQGYIELFDDVIKRDYVAVEDVCQVLFESWKNKLESGIYNLGSGNPISHQELADLVTEVMFQFKLDVYNQTIQEIDKLIEEADDDCFIWYKTDEKETPKKEDLIKKIRMPKDLVYNFQYLTKAEDLLPFIQDITGDNETKIITYINELLELEKKYQG
jgi:ADP-L-glycero-D-manno-heptose 6-epimerase